MFGRDCDIPHDLTGTEAPSHLAHAEQIQAQPVAGTVRFGQYQYTVPIDGQSLVGPDRGPDPAFPDGKPFEYLLRVVGADVPGSYLEREGTAPCTLFPVSPALGSRQECAYVAPGTGQFLPARRTPLGNGRKLVDPGYAALCTGMALEAVFGFVQEGG